MSIVEFVLSVNRSVVGLKFAFQMPKMKARKIKVNEIGNPIKITKSMALSMIKPIVGLDNPGRAFIRSVNQSPPGTRSGTKTARTNKEGR